MQENEQEETSISDEQDPQKGSESADASASVSAESVRAKSIGKVTEAKVKGGFTMSDMTRSGVERYW